MGNRNHGSLLKKATAAGLACLLLVAGLPLPAAAAESCKGWGTAKFFESATVEQVRACLSAGEDPNEPRHDKDSPPCIVRRGTPPTRP